MGAAEAAGKILLDTRRQPALRIPLDDALGSVLAEDVASPLDIPAWTNSAMDGYAARAEDVRGASESSPIRLKVVEHLPAGRFPTRSIHKGECARIFTGAPLPEGADSIIRQEDTDEGSETVTILRDRDVGVNLRLAGEDIRKGTTVLTQGTELGPAQLGVLASLAVAHPLVYRRPRIAILGSGDEIVDVDQPEEILSGRKIASSNTHTLIALVRETGGEPVNLGIAADTPREPARASEPGPRLRPVGDYGGHQRRGARLRAVRAAGARCDAAVLEASDAPRRTSRIWSAGGDPLDRSSGQPGEHHGYL